MPVVCFFISYDKWLPLIFIKAWMSIKNEWRVWVKLFTRKHDVLWRGRWGWLLWENHVSDHATGNSFFCQLLVLKDYLAAIEAHVPWIFILLVWWVHNYSWHPLHIWGRPSCLWETLMGHTCWDWDRVCNCPFRPNLHWLASRSSLDLSEHHRIWYPEDGVSCHHYLCPGICKWSCGWDQ